MTLRQPPECKQTARVYGKISLGTNFSCRPEDLIRLDKIAHSLALTRSATIRFLIATYPLDESRYPSARPALKQD